MALKEKKSTATAGVLLQSLIARAADENNFVLMASLDLSMAFDLVNTELLIKRLKIMGEKTKSMILLFPKQTHL